MPAKSTLPIIFLAYANDRIDPNKHLRNLSEEIGSIRDALEAAVEAEICEVLVEANVTVERIFSIFMNEHYRNRIAILHYAGHANDSQLLLELASGGHSVIHAEGLAAFLSQQRGLELVFLNGCSTEHQVQGLLDANCNAVVATSEAIDDQVAMQFARGFYKSLGSGASIEQAYNEAAAVIKTLKGSNARALYWSNASIIETTAVRLPWDLRIKSGAESVLRWNLPDAAGNPLFGLPNLPTMIGTLESPFRHLKRFAREHAEVFFGRGSQIRELYQAVTDDGKSPIILYYGQSGVGKSSVLDAGLLPRLEASHKVHYLPRDQSRGLLGTLLTAFDDAEARPGEAWRKAENEQGLPLLVVLDQVEEVFIRPNKKQPDELETFINGLHDIFGQPINLPRGRLILGFRKEWLPEIDKYLAERCMSRNYLFLDTIDRRGVIEAITQPTRFDRLGCKLEIEAGLAEEIADDLLADKESPVAPTLQILLSKLWELAREKNFTHPQFTRQSYLTLKREGILLKDFIDQQLYALEQWQPDVVKSGLALDILTYHTTPKGSAEQRTAKELRKRYAHHGKVIKSFVTECKNSYLLSDIPSTQLTPEVGARLIHDTLAPLIRERFDESVRPGQRARRILENRAVDWKNKKIGPVLDEADLAIIETGAVGMRVWSDDEKRLVKASRTDAERRRMLRKCWAIAGLLGLLAIVFGGVFSWVQWQETEALRIIAEKEKAHAESQGRIAMARLQMSQAAEVRTSYPQRALLLVAEAVKRPLDAEGRILSGPETLLRDLIASIGGLPLRGHEDALTSLGFDPQGRWFATGSWDKTVRLWDLNHPEAEPRVLRGHKSGVLTLAFDPQGRWLATGSGDKTARLWDLNHPEAEPRVLSGHEGDVRTLAFDPQGRWLATGSNDKTVRLWDLKHPETEPRALSGHVNFVKTLAFDPQGHWLAAGNVVGMTYLWDLNHPEAEPRVLSGHEDDEATFAFDPQGRWLATGGDDKAAYLWDLNDSEAEPRVLKGHEKIVSTLAFDPQGRWLATGSLDKTTRLWDLNHPEAEPRILKGHESGVLTLAFDPQGR